MWFKHKTIFIGAKYGALKMGTFDRVARKVLFFPKKIDV